MKDLFDTAGLVTTYGSPIFAEHVPRATAEAVRRLEDAGYEHVGKTNLHEFAYGTTSENPHFGTVPNPAAPGRIAGGSSGGSAAAIAGGSADLALGSDSGGSIRIPAACCGVVGFKPTFAVVPIDGCFPLAPSFDHAGPIAAGVAACAEAMAHLAPPFERRPLQSLAELSVGVAWLDRADPLVRERVATAASLFPRRGEVTADFVALSHKVLSDVGPLFMREVADVHRELFGEHRELYGADVRIKVERCLAVSDPAVAEAELARERYRKSAEEALAGFDLLVTPTLPCVAPPLGRGAVGDLDVREQLVRFTFPFNALGWPALALPCGPAEEGLAASVQLVGRAGDDALVLAAGEALERALARKVER